MKRLGVGPAVLALALAVTACGGAGKTVTKTVTRTTTIRTHNVAAAPKQPAALPKMLTSTALGLQRSLLAVRPRTISTSADGSAFIAGAGMKAPIKWSHWTSTGAQANAYSWLDNCTPDCAQGHYSRYHVTVTLQSPMRINGELVFTSFDIAYPGGPPKSDLPALTTYTLKRQGNEYDYTTPPITPTTGTESSATPTTPTSTGSTAGTSDTVQDFNGNTLQVTTTLLSSVRASNQFEQPTSGTRLVAIKLKLHNQGPGTISNDADSDSVLIGTNDQQYEPSFDTIVGCTNFNDGDYTLADDETSIGCVVFDVPNGVGVKAMQFTLGENSIQFNN